MTRSLFSSAFPGIRAAVAAAALGIAGAALADTDADAALAEAAKLHRIGQTQDAVKIWRNLAAAGQSDARYNLGVIHQHADGVPRDYAEAMKWYSQAAAQGDVYAQRAIGEMYMRGLGVARNEKAGMRWMMLDKIAAHHEHTTVARRWQGQLERAILQDEQQRLEQLYSQSLDSGEAVLADLKRRAGMSEEDEATRLARLP